MCKGNRKKFTKIWDARFIKKLKKLIVLVVIASSAIGYFSQLNAEESPNAGSTASVQPRNENAPEETKLLVICKKEKGVRTLRIVKQSDLCTVKYTKGTSVESIGEGKWFPFCEKIADGVRGNLEKAGYTCKVTKNNSVSELK
jgi:hypothetical protein